MTLRHFSAFLSIANKTIQHADVAVKIARLMQDHVRVGGHHSKKIDAIKEMRYTWGFGLREAKDVADTIQHHIEDGVPFTTRKFMHHELNEIQLHVLALVMSAVTM